MLWYNNLYCMYSMYKSLNLLLMCSLYIDFDRTLFGENFLTLGKWFAQTDHTGSNDNKLVMMSTCIILCV